MNSITPKAGGINYASSVYNQLIELRKQKSKEDSLPKSMSNNLKFDTSLIHNQHGILKHRSTSQHNINNMQMSQIQLFDQYFNQTKTYESQDSFMDFLDRQVQYHQQATQTMPYIFKNQAKKWEDDRKKLINDLQQYKADSSYYQKEVQELKKIKQTLAKRCDVLQELIVKERLGNQSRSNSMMNYKIQDILKNVQIPNQETVSSLADERFESNETSLDSSLSNDDDPMSPSQIREYIKKQHRYNFSKLSS